MTDGIFGLMSYAQDEIDKFSREHEEDIKKLHDELFDAMLQDAARIFSKEDYK